MGYMLCKPALSTFGSNQLTEPALKSLAQYLGSDGKEEKESVQIAQELTIAAHSACKGLKREHKVAWALNRAVLAGSRGRKTSVKGDFDFDMILFATPAPSSSPEELMEKAQRDLREITAVITAQLQPKLSIKAHFSSHLYSFAHLSISTLPISSICVEVDLLLAPNLVAHMQKGGHNKEQLQNEQMRRAWQLEKQYLLHGMQLNTLFPACCEALASFIAGQHAVPHEAARLLKAYMKHQLARRGYGSKIIGLSCMLELVAVHAYTDTISSTASGKGMLYAVRSVLQQAWVALSHLPSLRIVFTQHYDESKVAVAERPAVVDPANPYANLAQVLVDNPAAACVVQSIAQEALHRLQHATTIYELFEGPALPPGSRATTTEADTEAAAGAGAQ